MNSSLATPDEADVQAVVAAWTNPGINPPYHRRAQAKLRREWPTLARALDRLAHTK